MERPRQVACYATELVMELEDWTRRKRERAVKICYEPTQFPGCSSLEVPRELPAEVETMRKHRVGRGKEGSRTGST